MTTKAYCSEMKLKSQSIILNEENDKTMAKTKKTAENTMGPGTPSEERKKRIDICLKTIQNKFSKDSIMLLGAQEIRKIPVTSTGVFPIDVALSIGGIPKGRICEFFGPEGSGKTTVALYAIAACQKKGGVAAFLDVEHALDPQLAVSCGVKLEELIFSQPDDANQMLTMAEQLILSDSVDLLVIDSVAAMVTKAEMEGTLGESVDKVGGLARLMSSSLRKLVNLSSKHGTTIIFINQIRQNINIGGYGHGPSETTPGGRALKFYSSVRLEIKRGKQITKGEEVVGHELFVKVVKNKMAPPFKTAHCALIYGEGIPEDLCIVDMAIDKDILQRKGAWIVFKGETIAQGRDATAKLLIKDTKLREELKQAIMDSLVKLVEDTETGFEEDGEDADIILMEGEDGGENEV